MAHAVLCFENPRLADVTGTPTGTIQGLLAQVNAALAALTNPTIRFFSFEIVVNEKNGYFFRVVITYDTGGAVLGTPFVMEVNQAASMSALQTALLALFAANPTVWYSGERVQTIDLDDEFLKQIFSAHLKNATIGAGAANFLPQ